MLPVKINNHITSIIAFPVDLNGQIVISRVKINLDSSITIAVDEVADVATQLIDRFVYFQDDESDHRILIIFGILSVVFLNKGNVAFCSVGGSQKDSFVGTGY